MGTMHMKLGENLGEILLNIAQEKILKNTKVIRWALSILIPKVWLGYQRNM